MDNITNIFFLGIGGIGMSALAKYMLQRGAIVHGYDKTPSEITRELTDLGAKITFEDDVQFVPKDCELCVYTPAIPEGNKIFQQFKHSEIPMLKRSEFLGEITKEKFTIAVAGSHGKTSVSSMIAYVLKRCGVDCSAFLGGISTNFNSNYVFGNEDIVVVEADEFDRSFHRLYPDLIVITSIDTDHLDVYGSQENIEQAFQEFVDRLDEHGILIINEDAEHCIHTENEKVIYGFDNPQYNATNIELFEGYCKFEINDELQKFKLNFNGRHNIANALAAILAATIMDIEETDIAKALSEFKGIKRRFEYVYQSDDFVLIDDYAHHPKELRAILSSVREIYPNKHITVLFQPHLFSRTKDFYREFAESLNMADEAIILPIYPAREEPIEGVTSALIADLIPEKAAVLPKSEMIDNLKNKKLEVVLTVGAGDIHLLLPQITEILVEREK